MAHRTFIQIPFEATRARELAKSHGARWRRDLKQWDILTEHAAEIRQLIDEETGKRTAAPSVSTAGRTAVKIPFEASEARALAKRRGARWLATEKAWAVPDEHLAEVRQAIATDPGLENVCVGEPCNCGGMQIWQGECLVTGRSASW